jgi:hypothetical protein
MEDRGSIPGRGNDGNFSLRHRVQTGYGPHKASYAMKTGGSCPGGKAAGHEADHPPPSSAGVQFPGGAMMEIFLFATSSKPAVYLGSFTRGMKLTTNLNLVQRL